MTHENMTYKKIDIEGQGKVFQCINCEKTFQKIHSFYQHYNSNHKEKKFECEQCDKTFSTMQKFECHANKCNGKSATTKLKFKISLSSYRVIENEVGKHYECCQCEAKFKERGKFAIHFYRVHKEKTAKCDNCDKLFGHSSFLSIHLKKCKGKSLKYNTKENITYKKIQLGDRLEKVQCMICDEDFESVNSFHSHYSKTHKEKRFRCDKCSKSFLLESLLDNHLCQAQEKAYKCNKCSKSFDLACNVRRHNRIVHEKESNSQLYKKHKCDTCGKSFFDKLKLDKHLITHDYEIVESDDKIKQFQCKICKENFNSKPELYQHFYKVHLDKSVKTHECDLCDKIYTDTWKLGEHLKGHKSKEKLQYEIIRNLDSNKEYQCKRCEATLTSLHTFKKHFKVSHQVEKNDGLKIISSNAEVKSNLFQEVLEDATKKDHKTHQGSFDISTIKLSGTDVLAIANIREENDVIETDSNLKLESENMSAGELDKLYRVENNETDPIGTLNKEDMQIKTEPEETILGF